VLGWLSAALDTTLKRDADLTSEHNVEGRKTVVIGTPLWGLKPPPAVRSYLRKVNLSGKKVCAYCTYLCTGGDRTLNAVAAKIPGGLAARLRLRRPAANPNLPAILKEWAAKI
jgi:FMN-dependent NADH-azoreductase